MRRRIHVHHMRRRIRSLLNALEVSQEAMFVAYMCVI
jgi:hypothetical protein